MINDLRAATDVYRTLSRDNLGESLSSELPCPFWDGLRQRAAQFSNCLDPGLAIRQAKIRNDQIRRSLLIEEARKGAAARSTDDAAAPTA